MTINGTWIPRAGAAASVRILGDIHHHPALVLRLDPDRITLGTPAKRSEWPAFAAFLREIRDSADELAALLDPEGEADAGPLVVRGEFSESGG